MPSFTTPNQHSTRSSKQCNKERRENKSLIRKEERKPFIHHSYYYLLGWYVRSVDHFPIVLSFSY